MFKNIIRKYTTIETINNNKENIIEVETLNGIETINYNLIKNNLYYVNTENKIIEYIFLNIVYFFIKNKEIKEIY